MTRETHYCKTCKKQVPLAPGTGADPYFTVGIAHVTTRVHYHTLDFVGYPCPDAVRRTYNLGDQLVNLQVLLEEIEGWT